MIINSKDLIPSNYHIEYNQLIDFELTIDQYDQINPFSLIPIEQNFKDYSHIITCDTCTFEYNSNLHIRYYEIRNLMIQKWINWILVFERGRNPILQIVRKSHSDPSYFNIDKNSNILYIGYEKVNEIFNQLHDDIDDCQLFVFLRELLDSQEFINKFHRKYVSSPDLFANHTRSPEFVSSILKRKYNDLSIQNKEMIYDILV